jgi:alpha-galactosidase
MSFMHKPSVGHALVARLILSVCLLVTALSRVAGAPTNSNPTLFLIGDSTVRNGSGKGADSMWGWGSLLGAHFDPAKIQAVNRAIGGRSSRTFLTEGRWDEVMKELQPGDFVMMQFGHNDGGGLTSNKGRGSLKGNGEETQTITNAAGKVETVHSYGWYLRQYIAGAKEKGATPIVVSQIPRNIWKDGKVGRESSGYGKFASEAAVQGGAAFLDLNELVATRYEQIGEPTVREMFFKPTDHTHTTLAGAKLNAATVADGVRAGKLVGDEVTSRPAPNANTGTTPHVVAYKSISPLASYLLPPDQAPPRQDFLTWAPRPPMGWNSWDCFATTVTEAQTKANANVMADKLKAHGWEYVVVDIQWYEPNATSFNYRQNAKVVLDEFGRLWPATNRFPSAANGVGFKALSDYVRGKGLKFGIHLMRGIPRQAVRENTLVKGTNVRARDIANTNSICEWNPDMYGVDMTKPGAQAYYDSVFELIASWGVDYVKVDDLSRPYHANEKEVEAIRKAIDRTGRPMVLSLSPGETALTAAGHVQQHANLWRISDDFWDNWPALHEQFERLRKWNPSRGPGHWPDADMLPLGVLEMGKRKTHFTPDEQYTLMTLWSIARSPLMHGGDMTKMDDFTLSLLTNDEVLAVNQTSSGNRELFHREELVAWVADVANSKDKYVALFNAPGPAKLSEAKAAYCSPLVTRKTPGQGVTVDLDLAGARKLYLVIGDGDGDGFGDHADWIEPRVTVAGALLKLADQKWAKASTGWGSVSRGESAGGKPISVGGKHFAEALGAHSVSVIEYDLPAGATRFQAFGALDDAAIGHARGATVKFMVFTNSPLPEIQAQRVPVKLADLGFRGKARVRDLWQHRDLGEFTDEFAPELASHGAGLYRVSGEPLKETAELAPAAPPDLDRAYLFSYFINNGEDGLHLASSRDGYKWEALNGGKSFLKPEVGESKLMRDPCLLRGPDGTFHMVWTTAWQGKTIGYAASKDLINWTPQQAIPVMAHEPAALNCWAPEIVWDAKRGEFLIFWATTITNQFRETAGGGDDRYNHRMYSITTKDFKTYTPAKLFYEPGFNVIDATILAVGGKYHLIVKDETRNPVKKNLRLATSDDIAGPYSQASAPFTRDWVEGPSALQVGDEFLVYFDAYRDRRYEAMRSTDLKNWEDVTSKISFPKGTKHGTAIAVPMDFVTQLRAALGEK